jgi:hypothetical protein
MTAGYSGTPLAKKLGFKPGQRTWFDAMPDSVRTEIGDTGADILESPDPPVEAVHMFITHCATLDCKLRMLLPLIARDGMIWVSWPKKTARRLSGGQPSSGLAKVETDITEDVIRSVALPLGLVDVKVCAVDETWSGLKLVIRKELR